MRMTCKQCGKEFELPQSEIDFYKKKGLSIPKRCKDCRAKNNQEKAGGGQPVGQSGKQSADPRLETGFLVKLIVGFATVIMIAIVALTTYLDFYLDSDIEKESSRETKTFVVQQTLADTSSVERPSAEVESEPVVQMESESTEAVESEPAKVVESAPAELPESKPTSTATYKFRSKKLLSQHYEKHGIEMGFADAAAYEAAASAVIVNPDALYKTEAEDGDGVYYLEATNEFVILSTDGYIRTYFYPSGGKNYFDRQ